MPVPVSTLRHAVGLYRVSTAEQGQSGLGLEAQRTAVRAFAAAQGWTLVAEFSDVASGKDDRGHRPAAGPDAAAAGLARREAAGRTAHRLALEVERLRADGVVAHAALARALTTSAVPTPRGGSVWTHTTVARVLLRAGGGIGRQASTP